MNSHYEFTEIEKKWRAEWEKNPINVEDDKKPKFYCLDMFPYPSGTGLHVGHWRGYVLSDVVSRYKVLQGFQVLHPMGWDAFGLPAENFAIKNNIHPRISTADNITNVKRQLHEISAIYDWDKEVDTTDPGYYKWTQWIFVQMFKKGLAYEKQMPLNWCPSCKCVLANEEAAGGTCERCGATVTKRNLRQWMLKITAYADRLLEDLQQLDWSEKVKKMQSDWIGKSYGAEVDFKISGSDNKISVFTTRPDTLHGCTFMVLAPEYKGLDEIVTPECKEAVNQYCFDASTKSSVDRMTDKEKTGVFTGAYCVNPVNGKEIPVWVADYVLADYGTGAVMCVPAHDERDFDFATKFNLPIVQVILPEGTEEKPLTEAYAGDGVIINSGEWNGMKAFEAKKKVPHMMEEQGLGKKTVNYKLRDWVFSRQRYWGEPIPIIHCDHCGAVPVPEDQLPVLLPEVESYKPTDTGESPLAQIDEWVNTTCPVCGRPAKRETNTMPQWAGSSWYFLRYVDNHNDKELASMDALKKWAPVDLYVGGIEHAVLHLLYARFYTKFLYDIGAVPFEEPFQKLFNQGMITKNGGKMSKSLGNVVSPDELVEKYGCDSLRMYELFVGPPEMDCDWDDSGIDGVFRFLNRTWKMIYSYKDAPVQASKDEEFICNKLISDITSRLEALTMNTVVSGFMEYSNKLNDIAKKQGGLSKETLDTIVILLAPFVPHISEELWKELGHTDSVFAAGWPQVDESKLVQDTIEIAIQVSGKLRGTMEISTSAAKDAVLAQAKEVLGNRLEGKEIVKEIYVPGRIVNLIVK
ncbi:leucine--tRNA ligase [Anaerotignum neopropionicum]|uniref:Leucine--tRNA ligase n=1 Tax=Anaerotignum neopropionicum TaxID=36847 RepID=A0A136WFN1_9FIRM|nr:leucine--tRNA ligase [Anaerotignum neopropionicum]KXL53203.1 leucine--tRNA ligase [Anaerotignum neopropionicum]